MNKTCEMWFINFPVFENKQWWMMIPAGWKHLNISVHWENNLVSLRSMTVPLALPSGQLVQEVWHGAGPVCKVLFIFVRRKADLLPGRRRGMKLANRGRQQSCSGPNYLVINLNNLFSLLSSTWHCCVNAAAVSCSVLDIIMYWLCHLCKATAFQCACLCSDLVS